jgi:hypothetical protein
MSAATNALIAAISGLAPMMFMTRLILYASTCNGISAATNGSVFIRSGLCWLRSLGRGSGGPAGGHRLKFGGRARLKEGAGAVGHDQQTAGQQDDILQHEPPAA